MKFTPNLSAFQSFLNCNWKYLRALWINLLDSTNGEVLSQMDFNEFAEDVFEELTFATL